MEKFFKLKENGTNVRTEIVAGLTTFFAMAYIIMVNPSILSQAGMPWGAVFLATIIASVVGTLVMGLVANVPYAQAPGMGLNAFFVFTVVLGLKFTWQEALAMVFICGLINILITVTKIRKLIIKAIPESLQSAIGGGIGVFIAYIGVKSAGLINFTSDPGTYVQYGEGGTVVANSSAVPAIVPLNSPSVLLAIFGLILGVRELINIGIILFTVAVAFYLVTLPVEFNASKRAVKTLEATGILTVNEITPAKKVLQAAALTYVASAAVAIANLLRLVMLTRRRDD